MTIIADAIHQHQMALLSYNLTLAGRSQCLPNVVIVIRLDRAESILHPVK